MILAKLTVGDTLDFVDQVPNYPATDGWTLVYRLIPEFTTPVQAPITITASTYLTTDYRVQVAPAVSALWSPGIYTWRRWVEKSGARQTLDGDSQLDSEQDNRIELLPDPTAIAAGYDGRSLPMRALEDAQTALANFQATGGRVKSYAIAGRTMEFDTAGDILVLVKYWENEVSKENAQRAAQAGRPNPRRYFVRLNNG
jgi:hypothetical protein